LEAEDSEIADYELIEFALRDVGLEYIPKRAISMQNCYINMGLDTSVQQFVERLNDSNCYLMPFF
jgi:hypothetical protein